MKSVKTHVKTDSGRRGGVWRSALLVAAHNKSRENNDLLPPLDSSGILIALKNFMQVNNINFIEMSLDMWKMNEMKGAN